MNGLIFKISTWFEQQAYGVCASIGKRVGIKSNTIRMYFIYLSFFTVGSPVLLYFILAFLKENINYFKPSNSKRASVWDL